MLEQPLVSVDPLGRFHFSYHDFHLDQAKFTPLTESITIDSAFMFGLPPDSSLFVELMLSR
jgi:hypothetical protein